MYNSQAVLCVSGMYGSKHSAIFQGHGDISEVSHISHFVLLLWGDKFFGEQVTRGLPKQKLAVRFQGMQFLQQSVGISKVYLSGQ